MKKKMTIEVIPNPYAALDADGVPQGVVGMPGVRGMWIGAALDVAGSEKAGKSRFYFPKPNEKPATDRPADKACAGFRIVTLDVSHAAVRSAIANAILEGSLIAVTKEGAASVGLVQEFVEPETALENEKAKALAQLHAETLDESLELGEVPREATLFPHEEAEEEAAAAQKKPARGVRLTSTVTLQPSSEA